jgi:hypothetical protein
MGAAPRHSFARRGLTILPAALDADQDTDRKREAEALESFCRYQ